MEPRYKILRSNAHREEPLESGKELLRSYGDEFRGNMRW